jgi:hypothetical protein
MNPFAERVRLGMARARRDGKHLGRPSKRVTDADLESVAHLSVREAASALGVSKSLVASRRRPTDAAPRTLAM